MSLMMKNDGRVKFRAHPQPHRDSLAILYLKGSTRPTMRGPNHDKLKTYRRRAS